jgi:hypothetical protein
MSLKDVITKIAQEAALSAVNYSSGLIQAQLAMQSQQTGIMTVTNVDTSQNPILLTVVDSNGYQQYVSYLGTDYPYQGQTMFVDSGYAS